MKNKIKYLLLVFVLAAYSCDNITNEVEDEQVVDSFEFHISSEDNTGIIELPGSVLGSEVTDIAIINEPQGQYEVISQTFTSQLDRGENFYYVIYTAPEVSTLEDEVLIEITTRIGAKTRVLATPTVQNFGCSSIEGYSFGVKNYTYNVSAGDVIEVQQVQNQYFFEDGVRTDIPCEGLRGGIDYPNKYGEIRMHPIGDNLISIPDGRCCSFLNPDHSPLVTLQRYNAAGTQAVANDSDATKWNWIFTIPSGKTGTFRFLHRQGIWKTDVEGTLTGPNTSDVQTMPNYTPDWYSKMITHSYSLITFHVTD